MERPRLLYFADTMCSWCYGFAPEMAEVLEAVGDRAELILFSGGLRPFQKEPMPPDLREKLRGAYERRSGGIGSFWKGHSPPENRISSARSPTASSTSAISGAKP